MTTSTAIVLAGGEGTRLRPLTRNRPKPLLPVANRPILEYVFDTLIEAGIDQFHVVVGYKRERVQSHFGSTYRGHPISYHIQDQQLGSGHALFQARDAIDGPTLVVNGDQIAGADLVTAVLDAHDDDAVATLGIVESDRRGHYTWVDVDDGRVTDIVDNEDSIPGYFLNTGVYVFDPVITEAIEDVDPIREERSLILALQHFIDEGRTVRAATADEVWTDATYPWDILTVTQDVFAAGLVTVGAGARDENALWVHDTAHVHEAATLTEPVVIGPDATVGPSAVLGPYASLGENVTVGAGAVVQNSVLDADARVGQNATLLDCVTGQGARIGVATTVPGGPGDVQVNDRVFENERLGAVLADHVETGGGVTLEPGTLVGPGATLYAGAVIGGRVAADTEVRS